MKTRISLSEVPGAVRSKAPFKCNETLYAEVATDAAGDPFMYVVYSYGTHFPVAAFNYRSLRWVVNSSKYSRTTSRHQSKVRQGIPALTADQLDTTDMITYIRIGGDIERFMAAVGDDIREVASRPVLVKTLERQLAYV